MSTVLNINSKEFTGAVATASPELAPETKRTPPRFTSPTLAV